MMGFFGIIFFILVLLGIWWWVDTSGKIPGRSSESPEDILKRRYANGEIDREEYESRLHDLRS